MNTPTQAGHDVPGKADPVARLIAAARSVLDIPWEKYTSGSTPASTIPDDLLADLRAAVEQLQPAQPLQPGQAAGLEWEWTHEDELPEDMDKMVYRFLFPYSRVIGGVRMFPMPKGETI